MEIFRYKAKVWDDVDKVERTEYGVVCGEKFNDAMERLEGYYGFEMYECTICAEEETGGVRVMGRNSEAKNVWEEMKEL